MNTIKTDFDLNALRILVALEATRNVSRAAEAIDMSQSGFSTALARLRLRLGDQLFVRIPGGMEPTARALAIVETARNVLAQVENHVLEQPVFDPRTARAEFRLSMADVAEIVFMPQLLQHLERAAPLASIQSHSIGADLLRDRLETGKVDLALGYFPDLEATGFYRQRLYTHTFACIVRKGHPVLQDGLSKAAFQALGHAVVASPARSNHLLEQALERNRLQRRIVVSSPHHLSLAAMVAETDLVATVPLATADHFSKLGQVMVVPLPFRPPVFAVQQYWHRRANQDPRHQWLREQMVGLFNPAQDRWLATESALYGNIRPRRM